MGRSGHPLRERAVAMMRDGHAYPEEIAAVLVVSRDMVRTWRRRAGIMTREARLRRVRKLLMRELDES